MAEKFILTEEQRKIMNENGLDRINVWNRVKKLGWSIEKAITVPVRKANNEEGIKVIVDSENKILMRKNSIFYMINDDATMTLIWKDGELVE
ncbi:hypothetical protein O0I22_06260 [Staphylococcus pseudintermedius]|nr:hypothetical protein [Staphylococcus pseudintermedius]